jgi:hypothetical protein
MPRKGPIVDTALSFLISAGIIAFGFWVLVSANNSGWPLSCALLGLLPVVVGSASLYQVIREAKSG